MSTDQRKNQHKYSISKLLECVPNRFVLSLAIAKRARQLKDGAEPIIDISSYKDLTPITIAMREIQEKKLTPVLEKITESDESILEEIEDYLDNRTIEKLKDKALAEKKEIELES